MGKIVIKILPGSVLKKSVVTQAVLGRQLLISYSEYYRICAKKVGWQWTKLLQ